MRENILNYETMGYLTIKGITKRLKVRCTYQEDEFSNKNMKGIFHFDSIPKQFTKLINYQDKEYIYYGKNGILLTGQLSGFSNSTQLNNRKLEIYFTIYEMEKWIEYKTANTEKVEVYFKVPYIKPMEGNLKFGKGNILLKNVKNDFKICAKPYKIEVINYISVKDIDKTFASIEKYISLKTIIELKECKLKSKLNELESFMNDVMLCISFLLFHRVNWFSYDAYSYDMDYKTTNTLFYKQGNYTAGDDFLLKCNPKFNKMFTRKNVGDFINNYFMLPQKEKIFMNRIINSFLSLNEIMIFEAKFKTLFSVIEGIGKLIIKRNGIKFPKQPKTNEFIEKVMQIANIKNNFESKDPKDRMKWIITDYRNDLTHFNSTDDYDFQLLFKEFKKLMELARKLIIYFIERKILDFPYPQDNY